jgi:hypothetical protein
VRISAGAHLHDLTGCLIPAVRGAMTRSVARRHTQIWWRLLQYGLLASGHCELVIEAGLRPYDYLALVPVIEGAGGRISDWNGRPLGLGSDGLVVAAANRPSGNRPWRTCADSPVVPT